MFYKDHVGKCQIMLLTIDIRLHQYWRDHDYHLSSMSFSYDTDTFILTQLSAVDKTPSFTTSVERPKALDILAVFTF